jgi:hypothetical protein
VRIEAMPIRIALRGIPAARSLGLAAGVVLAVAALYAWRVATVPIGAGASVSFTAVPTGELAVSQQDAFLRAPALIPSSPGGGASAQVVVRNQSPAAVAVVLRALPTSDDLDEALHLKVSAGGAVVFEGPLGGLRRWTSRVLVFTSGASEAFTVDTWIPVGLRSGWRGHDVDVSLQLKARPA